LFINPLKSKIAKSYVYKTAEFYDAMSAKFSIALNLGMISAKSSKTFRSNEFSQFWDLWKYEALDIFSFLRIVTLAKSSGDDALPVRIYWCFPSRP